MRLVLRDHLVNYHADWVWGPPGGVFLSLVLFPRFLILILSSFLKFWRKYLNGASPDLW